MALNDAIEEEEANSKLGEVIIPEENVGKEQEEDIFPIQPDIWNIPIPSNEWI